MQYPLITFARSAATDANTAMDQLFEHFQDHYPFMISEDSNSWKFGLRWPTSIQWYVDTTVEPVAFKLFGLRLEDIAPFYQMEKIGKADFVFSMFHSRALIAASYATRRREGSTFSYIVHIDDHTDLMSPLLYLNDSSGKLYDPVFHNYINIMSPESIFAAIDLGLISKGSFLTSYLLMSPPGSLIHISETLKEKEGWLTTASMNYSIGGKFFKRTGVVIQNQPIVGSWHFQQTQTFPRDLSLDIGDSIWLDIDLDAFCNRYNGDSSRSTQVATVQEYNEMVRRIEQFLDELSIASWVPYIQAVSVAVSPGFFPSDYWAYAIPTVCDGIRRILCQV